MTVLLLGRKPENLVEGEWFNYMVHLAEYLPPVVTAYAFPHNADHPLRVAARARMEADRAWKKAVEDGGSE